MQSLGGGPAPLLIAAVAALRPTDRRKWRFRRLDHTRVTREFTFDVVLGCRLDNDHLAGAIIYLKTGDRLPHGTAIQPAIKPELPENFRMALIDPACEFRIAHSVAAAAFDKKIRRADN